MPNSRPFYFRASIFCAPLTFHYSRPSNFRAPCLIRAPLFFAHPKILMKILIKFEVRLFHILNPICMVYTTRNQWIAQMEEHSFLSRHLYDSSYEERLKALQLPSMEYRRKRGDMIQCFKIMNGLVRLDPNELFTPLGSTNTRGHQQRLRRQQAHKAIRAKSFVSQWIIKSLNGLPKDVIDAPSFDAFKNRLYKAWEDRRYKTSVVWINAGRVHINRLRPPFVRNTLLLLLLLDGNFWPNA